MVENIDLKALEKKAFRSTYEDGLWDIFFGMIFLGLGILWTFSFSNILIGFIIQIIISISAVILLKLLKKYITTPRLGNVKFSEKRKVKKIRLKIFLVIFVVINIIVLILTINNLFKLIDLEGIYVLLIIGVCFVSIPFIIVAYFLDFKRLYFIAIMGGFCFFIFGILDEILGNPWSSIFSFVLLGIGVIIWGVILFYKFLNTYPSQHRKSNEKIGDNNYEMKFMEGNE